MPTYQYLCDDCGNQFEEFQSITEEPINACPSCKGKPRRVISGGAGFVLRGSGFYQTDYRSPAYDAAKKKESTTATDAGSSSKATKSKSSDKTEKKSAKGSAE